MGARAAEKNLKKHLTNYIVYVIIVIVKKGTDMTMKKTYIINDREFECIVSSTFNTCVEVKVKTVQKFLGRKCLKTFGYGSFNPRQFGSIDKGVVSVIQKLTNEKDKEEREIKKWKEFEKTLDKPYII